MERITINKSKIITVIITACFLCFNAMSSIFALDIEVPDFSVAGPPVATVEGAVENISREDEKNVVGNILKYTITVTNTGSDSTWFDVEFESILGEGLELAHPITVNGTEVENEHTESNAIVTLSLGDIEGYNTDTLEEATVYVIEFFAVIVEPVNLNEVVNVVNVTGFNASIEDVNATTEIRVYVGEEDVEKSEKPIIDDIYEGDTEVTGEGVPDAEITVTFPDGTEVITTVDPDGTWSVDVPEGIELEADDEVTAVQTEEGKDTSDPENTIVLPVDDVETEKSEKPIINDIYEGDTEVTGEGVPGAEIIVTFPDGTEVTTTVDPDGTWSVEVPEGIELVEGDEVVAMQTEEGKEPSDLASTIVKAVSDTDNTDTDNTDTDNTDTDNTDTDNTDKPSAPSDNSKPTKNTSTVPTADITNSIMATFVFVLSTIALFFTTKKKQCSH